MKVSEVVNTLLHCPGSYPLEVETAGQAHHVLALEYSHDPARAVVKLAEGAAISLSQVDAVREITSHKVNPANDSISLLVLDDPGAGGANHEYLAAFTDKTGLPHQTRISFQNGPIAEKGVNGLTQEVLLAIVIDRLEAFQRGPFACKDNEDALQMIKGGLTCLLKRTQRRMAQGVEGTHKQHEETPAPAVLPEPEATIAKVSSVPVQVTADTPAREGMEYWSVPGRAGLLELETAKIDALVAYSGKRREEIVAGIKPTEPEATIAELNAAPAKPFVVEVDHVRTGVILATGESIPSEVVATHTEIYHGDGKVTKTEPVPTAPKAAPSIKRHRAKKEASE